MFSTMPFAMSAIIVPLAPHGSFDVASARRFSSSEPATIVVTVAAEFRAYDAMSLPHFIQSPMVPGGSAAARSGGLRRRRAKRPAVVAGGEAACGRAENCGGANGRAWERSARGPPRR